MLVIWCYCCACKLSVIALLIYCNNAFLGKNGVKIVVLQFLMRMIEIHFFTDSSRLSKETYTTFSLHFLVWCGKFSFWSDVHCRVTISLIWLIYDTYVQHLMHIPRNLLSLALCNQLNGFSVFDVHIFKLVDIFIKNALCTYCTLLLSFRWWKRAHPIYVLFYHRSHSYFAFFSLFYLQSMKKLLFFMA